MATTKKTAKKPAKKTAKKPAKASTKGRAKKPTTQSVATVDLDLDTPIPFTVVEPAPVTVECSPVTSVTAPLDAIAVAPLPSDAPAAVKRPRGRPTTGKPRTVSVRVSEEHFQKLAKRGAPNAVAREFLERFLDGLTASRG